ncbi:mediator complex subunit [Diatrype stigma]|uniref:Mediator of RNA polymerase II transcription subunit 14 n=1 Tax=Diatrype stigma TaxID=117547 RepID=A0AAN9V2G9_9PEZI
MENGLHNGLPTNHDRNRDYGQLANGSIGDTKAMVNGNGNGNGDTATNQPQQHTPGPGASRMNDLPDEIQHITQGFVPLGILVSRLAQTTHNALQERITALARIHVPGAAPAVNGNTAHSGGLPDDVSPDNLAKKTQLLNFIQATHARWVKALVIAAWSRKAEPVSKLIDLYNCINTQKHLYEIGLDSLINVKRDLVYARLPNPDLKTALQVLATGDPTWMPDLGYIEPPPISPKEQLQWIEELNTLLSLRLNLEDHDKVPYHFQDYSIESGRVTFRVPGEFEVDLTIADENSESQYWFVDFRFLFEPAPAELSAASRAYLGRRLDEEVLPTEGLQGCYNFLHEFVLTHKITEYCRQAFQLSTGQWVDTLKIERLNRAMSIQYWLNRYPPEGPKSWIIVGVHSGKTPGAPPSPSSTSHLTLRWFRDNKEVKDVAFTFDEATISTEGLLKKVIGKHIEHILGTMHSKLKAKGRFMRREASLELTVSEDEPVETALKVQLGHNDIVTVKVSPTTGFLAMTPLTNLTVIGEKRLNHARDATEDGPDCLELVRCHYMADAMNRRGKSLGWHPCKAPLKADEVRGILNTRERFQPFWYRRHGWEKQWHLLLSLSLNGDRWVLVEVSPESARVSSFTQLPLSSSSPNLTDRFFANLNVFTAGLISHIVDLRTLHSRRVKHAARDALSYSLPPGIKIPSIFIRLSDILDTTPLPGKKKRDVSWAIDFVQIMYQGIGNVSSRDPLKPLEAPGSTNTEEEHKLSMLAEARFKVANPERFSLLQGNVERDVAFNKQHGVFALRLRADVGSTILDTLAHRLRAIERLVDCIDAIRQSNRDIRCEDITLNKVTFTYSDRSKTSHDAASQQNPQRWKAALVFYEGKVKLDLESGNPHLRIVDLFSRLVNSSLRFEKLPFFLSSTLPVMRAFDSIEEAWKDLGTRSASRVEIFPVHLDWFNIRYILPGSNKGGDRRLTLRLRLRFHRGETQWHLERTEPGIIGPLDDAFKKALTKVWGAEDRVWENLMFSAAVQTDYRVETLLKAVDEAIRPLAIQSPSMTRQAPPKTQQTQHAQAQQRNQAPNLAFSHHKMANKPRPQQHQHQQRQQPGQGHVVVLDD